MFSSFYFLACSDDPSSLGSALLNQDQVGLDSLDSFKDTLSQTSSSYKYIEPQAASSTLLLGKTTFNSVTNEAYTLLSFNIGLADTIKSYILSKNLKIKKATIELDVNYKIGNPIPGFSFTGHKIKSGWTAAGFTVDSLASLSYENSNSIVSDITQADSMKFDIDTALASDWFTAEADVNIPSDNGILLKPVSTTGIVGFHSLSTSSTNLMPLLSVVISKDGWTKDDTLRFVPAVDLSVVKGDVPASSTEYMYVQSSVIINSLLKFDISKLPEHAIINYAQLEVSIDTNASYVGNVYNNYVLASVFSNTGNPDTSVTSSISLTRSGDTFKGNIASFVQNWLSTKINNGVLLRTGDVNVGVERFALRSSTASDPLLRPRLKIIFTNKK